MIIRVYWPQRGDRNETEPIDAFWVEATYEEAEKAIFPFLAPEAIERSKTHAKEGESIASQIGNSLRPYCFLVAQDLSTIEPCNVHYPFHHMWNGYSPFKELPECHINTLEELKTFVPLNEPIKFYHLNKPYGFFSNFAGYAIYLNAKIVEHTTNDSYWGDGGDGSGRNMLGKLLMETRERIRNELFNSANAHTR